MRMSGAKGTAIIRCFVRTTQPAKGTSSHGQQQVPSLISIDEVLESLKEQLNLSDKVMKKLKARRRENLANLSRFSFTTNCAILKDINVEESRVSMLPRLLSLKPTAVLHKVKLLQEFGNSRPTLKNIRSMVKDMKQTVAHFKVQQNIAPTLNIAQNVFEKIGHPLPKSSYLLSMSECMEFQTYYKQLQMYFKTQILKLPVSKNTAGRIMTGPSFRAVMEMKDVLTNEIGLDRKSIWKHPKMLCYEPATARALMEAFEEVRIENTTFKDLVLKCRELLNTDPGNIKELYEYIKECNISDRAILNCLLVFSISLQEFKKRLTMYMDTPEISPWRGHPRLLYLIYHHRIVKHRLQYLRLANRVNDTNVHVLSSSRGFFQRYMNRETNSSAVVKHMRYILYKEFDESRMERVLERIKEHPYWRNASLMDVFRVLQYLREKYTEDDIEYGIHLILYPLTIVQETLSMVEERYTPENGYAYTPGQRLTLCVYLIEKDNHFTGDAIWQSDGETTCPSISGSDQYFVSSLKQQQIPKPWDGSLAPFKPNFPDLADDCSTL